MEDRDEQMEVWFVRTEAAVAIQARFRIRQARSRIALARQAFEAQETVIIVVALATAQLRTQASTQLQAACRALAALSSSGAQLQLYRTKLRTDTLRELAHTEMCAAAVVLQSRARGMSARRRCCRLAGARTIREMVLSGTAARTWRTNWKKKCADDIQSVCRSAALCRKLKAAELLVTLTRSALLAVEYRRRMPAVVIQSTLRSVCGMQAHRKQVGATAIQAALRACSARGSYWGPLLTRKLTAQMDRAAVRVQAVARGVKGRKEVQQLMIQRADYILREAAEQIQRGETQGAAIHQVLQWSAEDSWIQLRCMPAARRARARAVRKEANHTFKPALAKIHGTVLRAALEGAFQRRATKAELHRVRQQAAHTIAVVAKSACEAHQRAARLLSAQQEAFTLTAIISIQSLARRRKAAWVVNKKRMARNREQERLKARQAYERLEGSGHAQLGGCVIKLDRIGRQLARAKLRVDDAVGLDTPAGGVVAQLGKLIGAHTNCKQHAATDPRLVTLTAQLKERAVAMRAKLAELSALPQMKATRVK